MDKNVVFRKTWIKPKNKVLFMFSMLFLFKFFMDNLFLWIIYFFGGNKIFLPKQKMIRCGCIVFYHSQQKLIWLGNLRLDLYRYLRLPVDIIWCDFIHGRCALVVIQGIPHGHWSLMGFPFVWIVLHHIVVLVFTLALSSMYFNLYYSNCNVYVFV